MIQNLGNGKCSLIPRGHNVSKHVHMYIYIVLTYSVFRLLCVDTASHDNDTGAILLANLGESLQDFQMFSCYFSSVFY